MPAATEPGSTPALAYPLSEPTPRWRWRQRDLWGFRRRQDPALPHDPEALLAAIQSELTAAASTAHAVAAGPATPTASDSSTISDSDLVELAIQTWRLQKRIDGLDSSEHARLRKQLSDSARRFDKLLERFGVEYDDPTGQPYTVGCVAIDVVAWDPFTDQHRPVASGPWVHSVISPIVRRSGEVIKCGQVVCIDPD